MQAATGNTFRTVARNAVPPNNPSSHINLAKLCSSFTALLIPGCQFVATRPRSRTVVGCTDRKRKPPARLLFAFS
jgi:hypothetical protein